MAFAVRDLSVLAYANGFTLWHYKYGRNLLAHIREAGYFNAASDMMAVGDMILASGREGAAVLTIAHKAPGDVRAAPLAA